MNSQPSSWVRARAISIIRILAFRGQHPVKTTTKEAWFLSPLRSETQASFHVSLQKNLWYDHGLGKGGNVIDLVMALNDCTFNEALAVLDNNFSDLSFHPPVLTAHKEVDQGMTIAHFHALVHPALREYIQRRGIPIAIANKYCKEVWYRVTGKEYFALGLQNDSGGWELRNRYAKISSSPKDYKWVKNGSRTLAVFEGMFDFLSWITCYPEQELDIDFLILNSVAFAKKAVSDFKHYECVELFLDRDESGKNNTKFFVTEWSNCIDRSEIHKGFNDLNDWLVKKKLNISKL